MEDSKTPKSNIRRKKTIQVVVLVFAVLCMCLSFVRLYDANPGSDLEDKLDTVIKKYGVQGASYAIIKNGQIASIHNIGYSNVEQKEIVEDNTAFKIASISKTITAYAVMQLVDQKILDLDTPVEQYIKNWKFPKTNYNSEKVTLRTLLDHTSGISDSTEYGYTKMLPSVEEALTQRNISLIREPGTVFEYSSFSGYAICQLVIENVTGEKFEKYMHDHVFAALGMKSAGYYNHSEDNVTLATPYAGMRTPIEVTPIVMTGAGGVSATSSDLAKFVVGLIKYYRTGHHEMFETQKNTESVFGKYALGIIPRELEDGTIVYEHNGTLTGWNAQIAFEPTSGNGIVFLCNSDKGFFLSNEVIRLWSKDVNGYKVEENPFEDTMSNIINAIWIAITIISAVLFYNFILDIKSKKRVSVNNKRQIIKLIVFVIIYFLMLIAWYGIMYTDYVFKYLYNLPYWFAFTFFTRNINYIGYSLILMIIVLILRRIYPRQIKFTGDEMD